MTMNGFSGEDSSDTEAAAGRKVVLLRAHAAAAESAAGPERQPPLRSEAQAGLGAPKGPAGPRPGRGARAAAGMILGWLGKNDGQAERRPPRPTPARRPLAAQAQEQAEAPAPRPKSAVARHFAAAVKAARTNASAAMRSRSPKVAKAVRRTAPPRAHAVNALKLCGEVAMRSASPCSPEPERPVRTRRPAHVRRAPAAPVVAAKRRGGRSSPSSSPVVEAVTTPSKRRRTVKAAVVAGPEAPISAATSDPPAEKQAPQKLQKQQVEPIESAADEGGFQAAIWDRVHAMCGEHEDAKVLAEYIVVMVAGNKGREEMTVELKPFFSDQVQAESFVDWVEECKWKFLTGGASSPQKRSSAGGAQSPAASPSPGRRSEMAPEVFVQPARAVDSSTSPQRLPSPAPAATVSVSGSPSPVPSGRSQSSLSYRARSLMGTGSVFEVPPMSAAGAPRTGAVAQPAASVSAALRAPTVVAQASPGGQQSPTSSPVAAPPSKPATAVQPAGANGAAGVNGAAGANGARQKTELLKNMTKQLQVILTKLNDKTLNDGTREKYQALAQNIQTQMAKISKPIQQQPQQQGRRRL